MGEFVSVLGKWSPKRESAMMKNTFGKTIESQFITANDGSHVAKEGENFLYNGPDREAVKMLREQGVEYFGKDFRNDTEFIQATRNLGFNSVDDYLKHIGFNEKEYIEKQEKLAGSVVSHETPEQIDEVLELAGGRDFTGNKANNAIGGFGTERLRSPEEITTSPRRGRPRKNP